MIKTNYHLNIVKGGCYLINEEFNTILIRANLITNLEQSGKVCGFRLIKLLK